MRFWYGGKALKPIPAQTDSIIAFGERNAGWELILNTSLEV